MQRILHRIPIDGLVTLIGFAGLALFLLFYDSAFPSAALHLTRSRGEIEQIATQYLVDMGYDPAGYLFALSFGSNSSSSIFLQRTMGIPETNRLINKENLPLWYWEARWFKIKQQEEFSVTLLPDGKISGFNHIVPETKTGARIEKKDAQAIAEKYLFEQEGWDRTQWEQVSASSTDRPNRVDYSFAWKRNDFNVGNAEVRLSLSIQGDRIGYYNYWFKVPEEFSRKFSEQRNLPNFISNVAYDIGMVGFSIIAIAMLIFPLLQKLNPLRGVMRLALLVGLVDMLDSVNYLWTAKAWYSTTQDWTLFWTQLVTNLLFGSITKIIFIAAILAGGQYIARQVWPRQDKILPRSPDRWGALARSGWGGFMLGSALMGYAVLFYLAATRLFGGWSPMGADNAGTYATPLPFIGPLYTGLIAGSQEEIIFRLAGVSLLLWWTRKKWLALLIPGALWAFAHLSYVRDPFYLRGIELLITAVFIEGLFFLYFDLTTTIVAHMTYNAMLGVLPLLRSDDPYLMFSGVLVILLLLSPVIYGSIRSRLERNKRASGVPQIRPARPDDLLHLAEKPVSGADWPALLNNPYAAALVLDVSGQVAGAAAGEITPDGSGRLVTTYVDPAWRHQFWGSRLVDEVWLRLEQLGAQNLSATIPSSSRPAYAFLGALGWQTTEQILSRQTGSPAGNLWRQMIAGVKKLKRKPAARTLPG